MSETNDDVIYRQAWYGNRPKSLALRRESDYHTGLSFSTEQPLETPFFVYRVSTLTEAGYTVEYDGTKAIISKWNPKWILKDKHGHVRKYGKDHVSVYREQDYWQKWYEAEQAVGGDGSTTYSQKFFELAAAYQEG